MTPIEKALCVPLVIMLIIILIDIFGPKPPRRGTNGFL